MAQRKQSDSERAARLASAPARREVTQYPPISRIILPVEPEQGLQFEAHIDHPVADWVDLDPRAWSECRPDGTRVLRADHFRYDKLVGDAVRARILKDNAEEVGPCAPARNSHPLVVLLESPHKLEYSNDFDLFEAQSPLNRPFSRSKMRNQLKRLTKAAGLRWADLRSKDVALVNPVPFQASMHRFFPRKKGLNKAIRDQVWCALFHQVPWFKISLCVRLCEYAPVLILNGCTKKLQDDVHDLLRTLPFRTERVTNHPSMWSKNDRLLGVGEVRVKASPCEKV